jgi:prevent-host-death family protein
MLKKVSAVKARQNLGQIINEVSIRNDEYLVERAGRPMVAIISMDKYRQLQETRDEVFKALDRIWAKTKGADQAKTEKLIADAVKSVRSA